MIDASMLERLLKRLEKYSGTCSIRRPIDGHVTFARSIEYVDKYLTKCDKDIAVIVPEELIVSSKGYPKNIEFVYSKYPEFNFTIYHNHVCDKKPKWLWEKISKNTKIHPTAVLGVDGLKVAIGPYDEKIQFIHTGDLIIEDDVEIGALTVVHRGTLEETVIKSGVKIGAKCNIAHNNVIGENTIFAVGVLTSGSVTIGRDCWFGTGAVLVNGISICDNVVIGAGSVVTKDITTPGIYVGNPARFLKQITPGWNF